MCILIRLRICTHLCIRIRKCILYLHDPEPELEPEPEPEPYSDKMSEPEPSSNFPVPQPCFFMTKIS
jgi:hypothetical protein